MKHYLLIIFLTIFCLRTSGQKLPELTATLDEYMKSANDAYRFNGVVVVVHKNEVLLQKGYGFSNFVTKTLNTPDTRFPILSITKTLTSTVILKLQEEGKLSVNDKLTRYLPDYPNGSEIEIHHLLTHSSGIYDYAWDVGIEDSSIINYPISKETVLNSFKDKPPEFRPGKSHSYSNSGYFLLGLIIEKVTGKSYETVVREYVFSPLGMTQSGFDFNGLPRQSKAQGYQFWNQQEAIAYKHFDSTFAYSAGSVYSTAIDLLKWAKAVSSNQILKPATWKVAFKPRIQNYAYGWQTGQLFGKKYVKHSGGYPGYMSEFIYYPDEELSIILLNNFGTYEQNVWSVGMGISSIVFGMPYDNWRPRHEVAVDPIIMESHSGRYSNGKARIEIKLEDNKLYAIIPGLPHIQLHAESDSQYFFENFNTTLNFGNNILTVHEHGQDVQWIKDQ